MNCFRSAHSGESAWEENWNQQRDQWEKGWGEWKDWDESRPWQDDGQWNEERQDELSQKSDFQQVDTSEPSLAEADLQDVKKDTKLKSNFQ